MSKSIMQDKGRGECYLCRKLRGIDTPSARREEHHAMHGTANRKLAEHYGLKVYLCPEDHRIGKYAVHNCDKTDLLLKQDAQRVFERKYDHEKWMEVFKINYLDPEEWNSGTGPAERTSTAAGPEPSHTCKNQLFGQINISQKPPAGFCFLEQDPGKKGEDAEQ